MKRTAEHNQKIGQANAISHIGLSWGNHTEEHKQYMSKLMKGRKFSEQHRKNLSLANRKNDAQSPLIQRIRAGFDYRQWRSDIFTRDEFTCQWCWKSKDVVLHAHHLKALQEIINEYSLSNLDDALNCEAVWDINNGITLCRNCHTQIENLVAKFQKFK
jgi:hypothetical protein